MNIPSNYLRAFGKIFSPLVMNNLAEKGFSGYLSEICFNSNIIEQIDNDMSLGEFLDEVYETLLKNYRFEYVYKNIIAKKILLARHSLDTSHMLTEFRVGSSKADVVILNGEMTVYEIKSEFDSFSRLDQQIKNYLKVFTHVYLITTDSQAMKVEVSLPERVGLMVLTTRNTIKIIRESENNIDKIDLKVLFDSLRKHEYTRIITEYFGFVPSVPNTLLYRECRNLFKSIPKEAAVKLVIDVLKRRGNSVSLKEFISSAPESMSAYAMSICGEKKKMEQLKNRFMQNFNTIVHYH